MAEPPEGHDQQPSPMVIGVGASAGGLEPFFGLLDHFEADSRFALVFLQHRSAAPGADQLLSLLERHTRMAVEAVEEGRFLRGGRIYVAPAGKDVALDGARFLVLDPLAERALHHPIDIFFRSLAEAWGSRAIGVLLSGTGADGSEGLTAIRGEGGVTFAQEAATAQYPDMPRNAVDAGAADFILAPEEIGRRLHRFGGKEMAPPLASVPEGEELAKILMLLRHYSGTDFSYYKLATIRRRVERRMALNRVEQLSEYVRILEEETKELEVLYKEILIRVTSFFRDAGVFRALKDMVLPRLLAEKGPGDDLRIWVPACSSGEEAFSLAMVVTEFLEERDQSRRVQIFATDLDPSSVAQGREGRYPAAIAQDVSPERLERFFTLEENGETYRVADSLREMCVFAVQNLVNDPPFSRLDLISCRNLLIYMGDELKERLLSTFHYALNPAGLLILGSSESVGDQSNLFSVVDKQQHIFHKKGASTPGSLSFSRRPFAVPAPERPQYPAKGRTRSLKEVVDELVLDEYAPPGVVVNRDMDVLLFRGRTGDYLEPPPGEPSGRVTKMAREGLLMDLHSLVQEAFREKRPGVRERVRLRGDQGAREVDLEAVPLTSPASGEGVVLVLFRESAPKSADPGMAEPPSPGEESRIRELEHELAATKEYLQATIEALEASNEELQSTNEELQSTNEELQSTSEELETSNEELKATNEALVEADRVKERRLAEADQAQADLFNLLKTLGTPVAIVDEDLFITRISPGIAPPQPLHSGLEGQSLEALSGLFPEVDVTALTRRVMELGDGIEQEVEDALGRWFLLRIHPYIDRDRRLTGVVLTLEDIGSLKRSAQETLAARNYAQFLMDALPLPILILEKNFVVVSVNARFRAAFGVTSEEVVGGYLHRLGGGEWDRPDLRRTLEDLAVQGGEVMGLEVAEGFEPYGIASMTLGAYLLEGSEGQPSRLLLVVQQITETDSAG
ncbi:CheR family methyltransferase [Thiohalorhabdus sp. Cl-TMA]|uniref:CheR family methyltransferase n=1 Tax=Thiohalorhabdus methylotrophus TaxID=3242694 RepID=A0ABV4TXQ0_9GAMM